MKMYSKLAMSVFAPLALSVVFAASPAFARSNPVSMNTHAYLQQPQQQQPQPQTFTGTIVKAQSGEFVLQAGGATYKLDNQSEAAKYVGKRVTVTGTLDGSSNTIQVSEIKPAT